MLIKTELEDLPDSITRGTLPPRPMKDLAIDGTPTSSEDNGSTDEGPLLAFDNNSLTKWQHSQDSGWIEYRLPQAGKVKMYTLTSADDAPGKDPQSWELLGSNDEINWTLLDVRKGESFVWRCQTRAFAVHNETAYSVYRLNISQNNGDTGLQIAEIELLGE